MVTLNLTLAITDGAETQIVGNKVCLSLPADASRPEELEWVADEHLAKFVQDASDILVGKMAEALKTPKPEDNPDNVIKAGVVS